MNPATIISWIKLWRNFTILPGATGTLTVQFYDSNRLIVSSASWSVTAGTVTRLGTAVTIPASLAQRQVDGAIVSYPAGFTGTAWQSVSQASYGGGESLAGVAYTKLGVMEMEL